MRGSPRIPAAAVTAVILLTLGGCGGSTKTVTVTISTSTVPAGQSSLEQNYVNVIGRVAPEVVQISTSEGLGSGVVFDKRGDVVTNANVVARRWAAAGHRFSRASVHRELGWRLHVG